MAQTMTKTGTGSGSGMTVAEAAVAILEDKRGETRLGNARGGDIAGLRRDPPAEEYQVAPDSPRADGGVRGGRVGAGDKDTGSVHGDVGAGVDESGDGTLRGAVRPHSADRVHGSGERGAVE